MAKSVQVMLPLPLRARMVFVGSWDASVRETTPQGEAHSAPDQSGCGRVGLSPGPCIVFDAAVSHVSLEKSFPQCRHDDRILFGTLPCFRVDVLLVMPRIAVLAGLLVFGAQIVSSTAHNVSVVNTVGNLWSKTLS